MNHFFTGLVSYGLIHQYPSLIHYPDTTPGIQIYGDVGDSGVNSGSGGEFRAGAVQFPLTRVSHHPKSQAKSNSSAGHLDF